MVAALKNRQIVSGREMLCRGKSGEIRICRFFSSLILMSGQQYLLTTVDEITDRVRAEKALDESNRRFAQVAESAGEWIWEVDADGRYTYSSPVVEEILGYTPKEIVGTYFYDYFEAGKREELKNAALAVFKEKKTVQHFLNPCLHKDGHIVMLESSGSPVLADDGTLRGYRGADLDVTDRMRAENALDESRERYRLMLMNAKDGIMINEFTAKGPGKFIEVNDTACRILGMTRDELEGLSLVDLDTEETHQRAPGFVAELEKNRHAVFQIPYRPKTGTEKTLDISVSIFELEGRPTMFSIVRDITGQVAMEQALRTSEERFRALVETSPDMVWEIDPEGKFRYISPQIEKIMGYLPEEVVGRTTLNLVAEQGKAYAIRELQKHAVSGQMNSLIEVPARHRDGHDMVIEIRSSRVTDRDGNPYRVPGSGPRHHGPEKSRGRSRTCKPAAHPAWQLDPARRAQQDHGHSRVSPDRFDEMYRSRGKGLPGQNGGIGRLPAVAGGIYPDLPGPRIPGTALERPRCGHAPPAGPKDHCVFF